MESTRWPAEVATSKTSDRELFREGWKGTLEGFHADGTNFAAHVVMTRRCGKTGMPIGFLVSSSDAMDGIRLEVALHRTRAYTHPALQPVPDAMVMVSAADERGSRTPKPRSWLATAVKELAGRRSRY